MLFATLFLTISCSVDEAEDELSLLNTEDVFATGGDDDQTPDETKDGS